MIKNLKQLLHDSYPIASAAVKLPERKQIFISNIKYQMDKHYPHLSETYNKRNNIRIKVDRENMVLVPIISKKLLGLIIKHNPETLI